MSEKPEPPRLHERSGRKSPRLPANFTADFGKIPLAHAVRDTLRRGYGKADLRADLLAGAVVAIVALPLSMALAIAVGVAPQHGLYTAIVAGAVVALLGGSRFQVTGPTAAFIVVLAPITSQYGLGGLLTAGLIAGLMLVVMGLFKLGKLIEFIPHPVTTGFTAGIATVIFVLQLKDALGLEAPKLPDHFPEKVAALWEARATISLPDLAVTVFTLALLLIVPRMTARIPAPLIAIVFGSLFAALLVQFIPHVEIATVGSRFQTVIDGNLVVGVPRSLPSPALPWGETPLTFAMIREILPAAFAIAVLGAIESLLSAVVADGMTGTRHESNAELVALGIGNIAAPFFGGIPATGALARTATNVRSGARSPFAAIAHALGVAIAVLVAAPWVSFVPMASLAALLMVVAWRMSEVRHAMHVVRVAPKSDVAVLLTCYGLTVLFDMVIAISFGVLLAALLFMRRMAELTQTRIFQSNGNPEQQRAGLVVPPRVALYEIAGPLFFGAAQRGMAALDALADDVHVIVLDLSRVPVIDASGLVALESALGRLQRSRRFVILGGPLPEPKSVFDRAELERHHTNLTLTATTEEALEVARDLVLLNPQWNSATGPPGPRSTRVDGNTRA